MKNWLYKENTGNLAVKMSSEESGVYRIWLHHDDFTPMELILEMLEKLFFMDRRQASAIMLKAREVGNVICGEFSHDVAATKVQAVKDFAIDKEVPLVCSMEAA